jgi:hypothetical protein
MSEDSASGTRETPALEPEGDDSGASAPESAAGPAPTGPSAGEAWSDVVTSLAHLGDSIAAWTRAAADNPENRRHLEEVRAGVGDIARKADAAFSSVASSDFGQQVKDGAADAGQAIGDTAQKVSDAAAPHVATAFAGLADAFGRAAARVNEAAARPTEAGPDSAPGATSSAPQPAAPAPAPADVSTAPVPQEPADES